MNLRAIYIILCQKPFFDLLHVSPNYVPVTGISKIIPFTLVNKINFLMEVVIYSNTIRVAHTQKVVTSLQDCEKLRLELAVVSNRETFPFNVFTLHREWHDPRVLI